MERLFLNITYKNQQPYIYFLCNFLNINDNLNLITEKDFLFVNKLITSSNNALKYIITSLKGKLYKSKIIIK